MFANFISENCTGTSFSITLTGASTSSIEISEFYSDTDQVPYVIEDADGIHKCGGVGTYNAGPNNITRNDTWTWDGTTYNDAPVGHMTLTGGTHTIRVTPLASDVNGWEAKNAWSDPLDADIIPGTTNDVSIGSTAKRLADINTFDLNVVSNANFTDGCNVLIEDSSIEIAGTTTINGDLIANSPSDHIGDSSNRWGSGYFLGLDVSGGIVVAGTVDGRDVSTDGAKLDTLQSTIGYHADVSFSGLTSGQVLGFNGSNWTNVAAATTPNCFTTFEVPGDSDIVADNSSDTFSFVEGNGIEYSSSSDALTVGMVYSIQKHYANTGTTQNIANTSAFVKFLSSNINNSDVSHFSTQSTINVDGAYQITFRLCVDSDDVSEISAQLYLNGTGIAEEIAYAYCNGKATATVKTVLELTDGDLIKYEAASTADGTTCDIITGTFFSIERIT